MRGIDFLARHAHHESFEYPSGLYKGGVIQRPWQENSSDDGDNDPSEDESPTGPSEVDNILDSTAERKGGNKGKGTVFRGPVATSGTGWLGGSKALYPYLVVSRHFKFSYMPIQIKQCGFKSKFFCLFHRAK